MQCLVTTWADVWDEPFRIGSESGDARRHGRVLRECPSGICISLEGPWTHPAARCGARLIGADVPNVTVPRVGRRPLSELRLTQAEPFGSSRSARCSVFMRGWSNRPAQQRSPRWARKRRVSDR